MHYYKRNLGDYAKKAGRLSMLQHGAYTLLIDACYDREQFPTLDDAIDWTWASSPEEIQAVEFVLRKFFILEDGVYVQKRIQEEIAEFKQKSETNSRIAKQRETNRKSSNTHQVNVDHESCTNREHSVHEAPPNQEPITINQEPVTKDKKEAQGKPARFDPRETVLPDCIKPSAWEAWVDYRRGRKLTCTEATMKAQVKNLELWWHEGHDPNAIIEASISNGWQGLFEPKASANARPTDNGLETNRRLAEIAVKRLNLAGVGV